MMYDIYEDVELYTITNILRRKHQANTCDEDHNEVARIKNDGMEAYFQDSLF